METITENTNFDIKAKLPNFNVGFVLHPDELFNQLQRLTRAGIWTIDLGSMEIIVSDEMYRMHGVPVGTPVTYNDFIEMMCIPEDRILVEEARIKAVTHKVEVEFEYRSIDQTTKEIKWYSTNVAPYLNEFGDCVALYGTTQDITRKKKEVFEKTQQRLATMGEAINLLAHHWRQPLSTVSTACSKLRVQHQLNAIDENTLISTLESIEAQAQGLSEIINDVKRIFSDVRLPVKNLNLNSVVQSLVGDFQPRVDESKILFKVFYLDESLPCFRTQHGRFIRSIVQELLLNAIESLESSSKNLKIIKISLKEEGLGYSIIVEDNGWGVSEDNAEKIFEPYYSTKKLRNGTGLGLYVSKMLAKLHLYGDLEFISTEEGACFKLRLPQMVSNM
jgi:signal transduction histidine kinase